MSGHRSLHGDHTIDNERARVGGKLTREGFVYHIRDLDALINARLGTFGFPELGGASNQLHAVNMLAVHFLFVQIPR
jgi:hypothetical protein